MLKRQRGLTAIAWLVVLGLVGVQAIMALRIIPVYMNYNSAKSIVESMQTDPDVKGKSPKQIRGIINKKLEINNLFTLLEDKQAFKFQKSKSGIKLIMIYEERGPIFGNLDFVASFNHEVELPTR